MKNMHLSVPAQHASLCRKVQGHYGYFGLTGNGDMLSTFVHMVERKWQKSLNRRSQRARMRWDRFVLLLKRYPLPEVRVVHSVYNNRSKATV